MPLVLKASWGSRGKSAEYLKPKTMMRNRSNMSFKPLRKSSREFWEISSVTKTGIIYLENSKKLGTSLRPEKSFITNINHIYNKPKITKKLFFYFKNFLLLGYPLF